MGGQTEGPNEVAEGEMGGGREKPTNVSTPVGRRRSKETAGLEGIQKGG